MNQDFFLPWDVSQHSHPSSNGAPSSLEALLSASRYISPDDLGSPSYMAWDKESQSQLIGGFILNDVTCEEPHVSPTPTRTVPNSTLLSRLQCQRDPSPLKGRARSFGKRLGRPLQSTDSIVNNDPKERRRRQVRLAQRAYRLRGAANVESLKDHVIKLETAMQGMSEAIVSFSDSLVHSGVLSTHENLTKQLLQVLQTCVASTDNADCCDSREIINLIQQKRVLHQTPPQLLSDPPRVLNSIINLPLSGEPTPLRHYGLFYPQCSNSLSAFNLSSNERIDIVKFTEQVRLACVYNMLLIFTNPSIPLNLLRGPCPFLLSLPNRESIISYFKSAFESRIHLNQPETLFELPFFQLGGAGTHYPHNLRQSLTLRRRGLQSKQQPTVETPLSLLSPEMHQRLSGKWFDIQDLLGFLQERDVRLFVLRPEDAELKSASLGINAISLLGELVSQAICLGRSPGFYHGNIEKALDIATWK
ncbi:hypothetical protein GGI43DRAFT_418882 [Trichoderma evansii]